MDSDGNSFFPYMFYGQRHSEEETQGLIDFLNMKPHDLNKTRTSLIPLLHKHIDIVRSNPLVINPPNVEELPWINTSRPLSFTQDLATKIYVMDFFTYCCINCIHILPLLKDIENEYAADPGFAIIGIHSPKFINERDLQSIKDAIIRHDIKHPVIHDCKCLLWKMFEINCWPTVFIVGPMNTLLFILVGENQINKLQFLCKVVVKYCKKNGAEDSFSLPLSLLPKPQPDMNFLYPAGISTNNELILVSDTGQNRLILMTRDLEIKEVIGSGIAGCNDGSFCSATFNFPHGTVWYGNTAFVADTGNHCIRKVDFISKQVTTVFKQSEEWSKDIEDIGPTNITNAFSQKFLSPWDVCIAPEMGSDCKKSNVLYIAVSGSHQIWAMHLENHYGVCIPFAGTGREENKKNTYRFQASFAQPTGITYSPVLPDVLYVADSESSAIRVISLKNGAVDTIVGGGFNPQDLFAFGDEDGNGLKAKFQHPMSVCVIHENFLLVADTYNHKIKLIHLKEKSSSTFSTGIKLCEPTAVCLLDDNLVVADTNNHRIIYIHIEYKYISEKIFRPLQKIQCYKIAAEDEHGTYVELKYSGKINCYFNQPNPQHYPTKPDQAWDITFKGEGKFSIKCNSCQLFNPDIAHPAIILTAEDYDMMKGYNKNVKPCEIKFILHANFCDSLFKTCLYTDLKFKIVVRFSENGSRSANLYFVCNL